MTRIAKVFESVNNKAAWRADIPQLAEFGWLDRMVRAGPK